MVRAINISSGMGSRAPYVGRSRAQVPVVTVSIATARPTRPILTASHVESDPSGVASFSPARDLGERRPKVGPLQVVSHGVDGEAHHSLSLLDGLDGLEPVGRKEGRLPEPVVLVEVLLVDEGIGLDPARTSRRCVVEYALE